METKNKQILLTPDGLAALEAELEELKTVRRKECSEKIKVALSFGDLSENSEYDEAKNEQAEIESRITEITNMLKNVKLIDGSELGTDVVSVGSTVTILDIEYNEEETYTIVGSTEADPKKSRISDESPVGSALLGHAIGDVVPVAVPSGTVEFKIINIAK